MLWAIRTSANLRWKIIAREEKRKKMAGCTIGGYARANFSHNRSCCSERQVTLLTLKQTTVVGTPGETSCTHIFSLVEKRLSLRVFEAKRKQPTTWPPTVYILVWSGITRRKRRSLRPLPWIFDISCVYVYMCGKSNNAITISLTRWKFWGNRVLFLLSLLV